MKQTSLEDIQRALIESFADAEFAYVIAASIPQLEHVPDLGVIYSLRPTAKVEREAMIVPAEIAKKYLHGHEDEGEDEDEDEGPPTEVIKEAPTEEEHVRFRSIVSSMIDIMRTTDAIDALRCLRFCMDIAALEEGSPLSVTRGQLLNRHLAECKRCQQVMVWAFVEKNRS